MNSKRPNVPTIKQNLETRVGQLDLNFENRFMLFAGPAHVYYLYLDSIFHFFYR